MVYRGNHRPILLFGTYLDGSGRYIHATKANISPGLFLKELLHVDVECTKEHYVKPRLPIIRISQSAKAQSERSEIHQVASHDHFSSDGLFIFKL